MKEFNESRWANAEFAREYRDNADIYIVERERLFEIMKSYYRHFLADGNEKKVLDLGCGDGIVTSELLSIDDHISSTLVDPSVDMLEKARERFKSHENITYKEYSFQDIVQRNEPDQIFDFVVSAQAIHHLDTGEKREIFTYIHSHLDRGGHFLNIDVIRPDRDIHDNWYMELWKEWMDDRKAALGIEMDSYGDIIRRYKGSGDNKPDTLEEQLHTLKEIGFQDVDCFYKYGIFVVYGGRKEEK